MKLESKANSVSRTILTVGVIISVIAVTTSVGLYFFGQSFFEPNKMAEPEFKRIAIDYYENYLYPNQLEEFDLEEGSSDIKLAFEKYIEPGFPPVRLRQLLLYDDGKNSESEKYFKNNRYECDTNKTNVKFIPVAPFGRKDYTMEIKLFCEE